MANGQIFSETSQTSYPKASNMQKLSWDNNLATLAQRWVNQCLFQHDSNENKRIPPFGFVGQNLYWFTTSGSFPSIRQIYSDALKGWFEEYKDFPVENIKPFTLSQGPAMTGHFTAMAWATTSKVGCGMIKMIRSSRTEVIVACNYGPGGNIIGGGFSMYEPGNPCSRCPQGLNCIEGLLCG